MSDLPRETPAEGAPYKAPVLTELGSVQLLTLGGTQGTAESNANQMQRMA